MLRVTFRKELISSVRYSKSWMITFTSMLRYTSTMQTSMSLEIFGVRCPLEKHYLPRRARLGLCGEATQWRLAHRLLCPLSRAVCATAFSPLSMQALMRFREQVGSICSLPVGSNTCRCVQTLWAMFPSLLPRVEANRKAEHH